MRKNDDRKSGKWRIPDLMSLQNEVREMTKQKIFLALVSNVISHFGANGGHRTGNVIHHACQCHRR